MNELSGMIEQAKKLHQAGDFKNAHASYQQILNNDPDNADVLYHMGILLFQTKNVEQTIPYFEKALRIDPMHEQCRFFLGIAFFEIGRLDSAMTAFDNVLQKNPDYHDANIWRAKIFAKAGYIDQAYSIYFDLSKKHQTYLKKFPDWILTLSIVACSQIALNEDDEKKKIYSQKAIQLFEVLQQQEDRKYKTFGHYHTGLFSKLQGNFEKATMHFLDAKTLTPGFKSAAFYYELLKKYLNKKKEGGTRKQKRRVVFHVGYPKAGSTWLQSSIFPNLCGTHHLGLTFYNILDSDDNTLVHYGYPTVVNSINFQLRNTIYEKEVFMNYFRKHLNFNGIINTISDEALLQLHPEELISRLSQISKELDVDVKIIVIIRKQSNIVKSEYGQGILAKKWMGKRLKDVIDWGTFTDQSTVLSLKNYEYFENIILFEERLGNENVLVIPFENMFSFDSLEKIVKFVGADNTREHLKFLTQSPPVNKTTSNMKEEIDRLNPDMEAILLQIDEHFASSNKALDKKLRLGLKDLNYY